MLSKEVQMPNGQDVPPNQTGGDVEIKAMNSILDALKPLTEEERRRVWSTSSDDSGRCWFRLPLHLLLQNIVTSGANTYHCLNPAVIDDIVIICHYSAKLK
jgi:hypothetical protein